MKTTSEIKKQFTLHPGLKTYTHKMIKVVAQEFGEVNQYLTLLDGIDGTKIVTINVDQPQQPSIFAPVIKPFDERLIEIWKWTAQWSTEPARYFLALRIHHN